MSYLYLVISGILFGGIVFFGKVLSNMGASTMEVMLYSNFLSGLFIAFFVWKSRYQLKNISFSVKALLTVSVLMINAGQYIPLFLNVSVTLVVLLLYIQPVWTILIERFYFKQIVSRSEWLMVGLMIVGLVILIDPFHHLKYSKLGFLIAILGGIGLSLWVFCTRYFIAKNVKPAVTYVAVCFYASFAIFLLYLGLKPFITNPGFIDLSLDLPAKVWGAFVFYALVILALPNILLYANSKAVPAEVEGMILLLEPVTGIFLDVTFFHMALTWNIILGGLIILGANIYVIVMNKKKAPRQQ